MDFLNRPRLERGHEGCKKYFDIVVRTAHYAIALHPNCDCRGNEIRTKTGVPTVYSRKG